MKTQKNLFNDIHEMTDTKFSKISRNKSLVKDQVKATKLLQSNDSFKIEKWCYDDEGSQIKWKLVSTSIGEILIASTAKGVCFIGFGYDKHDMAFAELKEKFPGSKFLEKDDKFQEKAISRIDNPKQKTPVHLRLRGTAFQLSVWRNILRVPFGGLTTYGQLGNGLRDARAVGTAVGANPVCFIIGCHRVVRADGNIENFHYGTGIKRKLLAYEAAMSSPS